jgi:magnesium transporter
MITVRLHAEGEILDHDLPLDRISDALAAKHSLVWADVIAPTNEDLSLLEDEFEFHGLALEDASLVHERPKVDEYDRFLLIIFYAISGSEGAAAIELEQISIFAGANFVVTMHGGELPMLDVIGHRWQANHARIGIHGAGLLVYSILDALVDGYLPVIDQISDRIDTIEDTIFGRFDAAAQQEIFQLKRDLLQMRKVLTPERDVLNLLMRRDTPVYSDETARYFQDIYDHLLRVLDSVDTFRDLLSSALDSYVSILSNRTNQVMKTLTASSIILMTMTLVAGIYGMNFEHMPELNWRVGYPLALAAMAAIGLSLGAVFKRKGWF